MYQAFLTAHAYETALRNKQGKNGSLEPIKINEMEADFDERDMNAENDAIRHKYQKKMFWTPTMDRLISNIPTGAITPTPAAMATATTAMAATNNPDPGDNENQTQCSVIHATTAKRKITSKPSVTKERGITLH
jgi:hypothetical protein